MITGRPIVKNIFYVYQFKCHAGNMLVVTLKG